MDGFTYHNIFDTKGIEYLVVIAFLLLLIPFWILLNRNQPVRVRIRKTIGILSANLLNIPEGFYLSPFHTWAFLEKDGIARVGMDDFLAHLTGTITIRNSRNVGETIHKGELLAEIEQQGKQLKLFSPVTGKITKVNPLLSANPRIMQEDPYEKGWIYNLKPVGWVNETRHYFLLENATIWLREELLRFKDFLSAQLNTNSPEPSLAVLQDGGELRDQTLSELPGELWTRFQEEFLSDRS